MMIHALSRKLTILNLQVSGHASLFNNCSSLNCTYCPYLYTPDGKFYMDDHYRIVKNPDVYPRNCKDYYGEVMIQIDKGSSLEVKNVLFSYFQQQYKAFISSQGPISFYNVTFYHMQPSPLPKSAVIVMDCDSNCKNVDFQYEMGSVVYVN